jgi:thiamine biosynthesis protein ThiI
MYHEAFCIGLKSSIALEEGLHMERIILVRYEEIFLKGLNRNLFENRLIKNIKAKLHRLGRIDVTRSQSRIYIASRDQGFDYEEAITLLKKIFGIASVSLVSKLETDHETIRKTAIAVVSDLLGKYPYKTFKVETKRGDKSFPLNSPQVSAELGGLILDRFPQLSVDVNSPNFILYVEIRESPICIPRLSLLQRDFPQAPAERPAYSFPAGLTVPWQAG